MEEYGHDLQDLVRRNPKSASISPRWASIACSTKSQAHRRQRDVLFGRKPIEIKSILLPESYNKAYLTHHNDELKKNAQTLRLAQAHKRATQVDH